MNAYNSNRNTFKRKEYGKSYRPWNLQNLNKSAKSKTEAASSSCTIGDNNSSKTSSAISATSSSPPLPQQNIQSSSFDEKNQYFVSSSISNTDNTWVSNKPLTEKPADTRGAMASNQQEQSQKRPAPVQTSALLNSQPSDFGGVNPISATTTTPTTFASESATSWTTSNTAWETTTTPWKPSINETSATNQPESSWYNDIADSDTSSKDTSWTTAKSASPPVESELGTESEVAMRMNDMNINSNQQQQSYPVPDSSYSYCTTSTMLPPTPTAETHLSTQLAQWIKEPPTPSSSRRATVEYIGGSSGGAGGWGKGELVNDWDQFNKVMANVTSTASTTTQRKPIPMSLNSEVSPSASTGSFANPYSFQQQEREQANWSKSIIDNSGVIQEKKITIDRPSPGNDSFPTAAASSTWTSYSSSAAATEQVWHTSNVNAATAPVMTTASGDWTDPSRGVQHDTTGTMTTANYTKSSSSYYAQQEKTTSTTITTENDNWDSPPRPTTQHAIATTTTTANTNWSNMPDAIANNENVNWSTSTTRSSMQAKDIIPQHTPVSSNTGSSTTISTTNSTWKLSATAPPWLSLAPTKSISLSSSSFSQENKTDKSNVIKTLKYDPSLDFAKVPWDDVSDEPGQEHDVAKSLPAKTTSMIKSSTKQYYGDTSNDSIHNPDRIVDDEEEEEEEWVTSNIQAFQSPTPTSSFATDPSFAPSPPTTTSSSSSSGNIIHSHRYAREELYYISTQQGHDIGHHAASLVNKQMQGMNKRKYKRQECNPSIVQIREVRQPPRDHSGGFSPGIPAPSPRTSIVVYHGL